MLFWKLMNCFGLCVVVLWLLMSYNGCSVFLMVFVICGVVGCCVVVKFVVFVVLMFVFIVSCSVWVSLNLLVVVLMFVFVCMGLFGRKYVFLLF